MARIPLAEIPNSIASGPGPAMIDVPNFRVNMGPAGQMLEQRGVNPAPFIEAAGASAQLGQAVAQVGGVFEELAGKMADSKNVADLSRAEDIMNAAAAAHDEAKQGRPEDEWVPMWEKDFRPKMEADLNKLGLSRLVWDRVAPEVAQFDGNLRIRLNGEANKVRLGRDRQALENGVTRALQTGDYAGAYTGVDRLVTGHHLTKEQGEARRLEIWDLQREKTAIDWYRADPDGFVESLDAGQVDVAPHRKNPLRAQAIAEGRQQKTEVMQKLDDDILTGRVRTPEEIRQRGIAGRLAERDIRSFVQALGVEKANSPEGRQAYQQSADALWRRCLDYDPAKDADGKVQLDLYRQIRTTVVEGERQYFLNNLNEGARLGRTELRQSHAAMEDRIDIMRGYGLLVPRPQNPGDPAAMAAYELASVQRASELKQGIRAFLRENPKASSAEIKNWLDERTGAAGRANAAAFFYNGGR